MVRTYHVCIWYQWIDHSRNALLPMYMNVPWVVLVTETHCGFHLVGFRNALLRLWWAISPQVHNHCTGGPGKWWAATGGPGERHWNRGWAEAVKATCNGHQCYTGAMGALLLGHHDHAQNFEQRQKDSAQWYFNLTSEYLFFYHCQHISTLYGTATSMVNTSSCDKSDLFRQLCT